MVTYIIITALVIIAIGALIMVKNYYYATAGILYYLLIKHNEELSLKEIRQLSDEAKKASRRIRHEN